MRLTKLLTLSILALSSAFILVGCGTQKVSQWDNITVSYDSYLQDGKLIEEWVQVSFVVWLWQTFPAFDKEVINMKLLQVKEFIANVEDGYGVYHDANKVQDITTTVFNMIWNEPQVWEMIELWDMKGLVLEVWPITLKIDFNEPQTREPVEFKIKILEINENE